MDNIRGLDNSAILYTQNKDAAQKPGGSAFNVKDQVSVSGSFDKALESQFRMAESLRKASAATIQQGIPIANISAAITAQTNKIPPYRFADKYTIDEIMNNPEKAAAFEKEYLQGEAPYFEIARNPVSGLTYDGWNLNEVTGKPEVARDWSAPSKECLDLGVLIKALNGDPKMALVTGGGDVQKAREKAVDIMDRKIDSYFKFYNENPEFGGFLPWFKSGETIKPMGEWTHMVPGLDNGEWAWTLLTAEKVLRDQGQTKVADKYAKYLDIIRTNAVTMFYDPVAGKVKDNIMVQRRKDDNGNPVTPPKDKLIKPGQQRHLTGEHAVHEGQMMVLFVTLFGKNLPEDAPKRIWSDITIDRVEHKNGTTWKAFWGSAHESWAYLFLPYRDMPEFRDLYRIREEIRSQNSADRGYPGFGTSTNQPGGSGYVDGTGIEGIGTQPVPNNHLYAIYGAFPMLHVCADPKENQKNYGMAWLLNMLQGPKMQNHIGGGESCTNDGKLVCPIKTMDGSFPNILAISGGIEKETAAMLKQYGKYDQFIDIMRSEYKEGFGTEPLREPSGFALPKVKVPRDQMGEFEDAKK
ncbi:MAG: hypothetical protein LWY06_05535 [Firmicutes bacterium]|nr:hypothetical protein [Bacillota bacterium]